MGTFRIVHISEENSMKQENQDSNLSGGGDLNAGGSSSRSCDEPWSAPSPQLHYHHLSRPAITGNQSSSTGVDVVTGDFPNHFNLDAHFVSLSRNKKNKQWAFSARLNKLFVDINRWVQVQFRVGCNPPPGLDPHPAHLRRASSHAGACPQVSASCQPEGRLERRLSPCSSPDQVQK
jgi:hypothetical protein